MAKPPPARGPHPSPKPWSARAPPARAPREAATLMFERKRSFRSEALVAAADGFAHGVAFQLEAAARAERGGDAGSHEQAPHQRGPQNHVRNEQLAAHTSGIGL